MGGIGGIGGGIGGGEPRWRGSRLELRRSTEDVLLVVNPHHMSRDRVVADMLVTDRDAGREMDAGGWSKVVCPTR
jgi:hypothetical protein